MNKTKSSSLFIILIILISICNVSVTANDDNEANDDNFSLSISGYSKFVILDDIVVNSQFNSTWESSITLSDQIGTDLLDNTDLGLRAQICLLYTSPSPRDVEESRMPSSA